MSREVKELNSKCIMVVVSKGAWEWLHKEALKQTLAKGRKVGLLRVAGDVIEEYVDTHSNADTGHVG